MTAARAELKQKLRQKLVDLQPDWIRQREAFSSFLLKNAIQKKSVSSHEVFNLIDSVALSISLLLGI